MITASWPVGAPLTALVAVAVVLAPRVVWHYGAGRPPFGFLPADDFDLAHDEPEGTIYRLLNSGSAWVRDHCGHRAWLAYDKLHNAAYWHPLVWRYAAWWVCRLALVLWLVERHPVYWSAVWGCYRQIAPWGRKSDQLLALWPLVDAALLAAPDPA